MGHGGADAGYRSFLGRFPKHGVAVAVLCNAAQANPGALARGVAEVFIGDRLQPAPAPVRATATLTAAELARYAGPYVNTTTGGVSFLSARGDSLIAGRTAGLALLPMGGGRFRVAGQPVELEMTPDGAVQTILAPPRRAPVRLRRETPARFTRAELERFAGTYHGEELGSTYTVTAGDTALVLKTRGGRERPYLPAFGDTFTGDFTVRFVRERGEVTGMRMSSGRTRDVAFEKQRR